MLYSGLPDRLDIVLCNADAIRVSLSPEISQTYVFVDVNIIFVCFPYWKRKTLVFYQSTSSLPSCLAGDLNLVEYCV